MKEKEPTAPDDADRRPRISVVVPVFDVEDHVGACLASLRAQVGVDLEVIVIDDGSTDASRARAEEAIGDDPRFRLISQDNRGLSAARNAGMALATGDLLGFVDGDDRVMPDMYPQMARALEEDGASWVACAIRFVGTDPGVPGHGSTHSAIHGAADLARHPAARRYALDDWREVARHFPSAWNKLYRRELVEDLRFPEGTWFEDHGFYWRAAARTDHILHLPQTLYLQTRGRPGQITAADDDRVSQQFGVIDDIAGVIAAGGKSHGEEALERIASRLVFERSSALRDPARRTRFAAEAGRYLAGRGLAYAPGWDPGLARSWALEMAGELPLTVILDDGETPPDPAPLAATLDALADPSLPGHEILLCVPPGAERSGPADPPALRRVTGGRGAALAAAQGRFVVFLAPGDIPVLGALGAWVDTMLQTGAQLGVSQFRLPEGGIHSGFLAPPERDPAPPVTGTFALAPEDALALAPELPARIFDRAFLAEHGLAPGHGPRGGWATILGAGLLAERAAYLAWPGMAPARPAGPGGTARDLARSHDAMLRALPRPARDRLPRGWERRLFARALAAEIDRPRAPEAQARFLRGAAWAVAWRRLGGVGAPAAGWDPEIAFDLDPRLAPLMDPRGLIRGGRAAFRARIAALSGPAPAPVPPIVPFHVPLRAARLGPRATLRARAGFRDARFANLALFDATRRRILLHLSLQPDQGRVVLNDRHGDDWGEERIFPVAFDGPEAEVEIALDAPRLDLRIDGVRVARLGAGDLAERDFTDLHRIAWLDLQGGFAPAGVEINPADLAPGARGALALDARLMLSAHVPGPEIPAIEMDGGTPPPLFASRVAGGLGLRGPLPGRVWRGVEEGAALTLRLAGAAPLVLTRADLAARIQAMLTDPTLPGDPEAAMLAIEHVRFAGLAPRLSSRARDGLARLARHYGLETYLAADGPAEGPKDGRPDPFLPPADPDQPVIDACLTRLAEVQAVAPELPLLDLVDDLALQAVPRRKLFLNLSEVFALHDADLPGLVAHAAAEGHADFVPGWHLWSNAAMLPFLLEQERFDDLLAAMASLVPESGEWIATAPLGWTIARALGRQDLPEEVRMGLATAFLDFLAARAGDYWARTPCRLLVRATVALLGAEGMAPELAARARDVALSVHALSPSFWDAVDEADLPRDMRAGLAPARDAFEAVHAARDAAAAGPLSPEIRARLARALDTLAPAPAATWAARDLLGPAGGPVGPGTPGTALLRHMAMPGAEAMEDGLAARATAALPELYPDVPEPHEPALTARLVTWLARADPAAWTGEEPEWAAMGRIAGAEADHLGIALALRAAGALGDVAAETPVARALLDRLAGWRAEEDGAVAAPAVVQALWGISRRDTASARAARALFADTPLPPPAPSGTAPAGRLDTVVVVISCRAHLETRIPPLAAAWADGLEAWGVPWIVAVGGGDGRREGRVVHLDAPDDYEGLPFKVLAAVEWVRRHTGHAYMIKIDDDCFLDVDGFLAAQDYARSDYHGRALTRVPGQLDRAWHNGKSRTERGRFELDRSPEPSSYADGGSGYALSRTAMEALARAAATPLGQRLAAASFMEDKLVGDLLSLSGIAVDPTGHRVTVRRRARPGGVAVPAWVNGFDASRAAPVRLVHLDAPEAQTAARARLSSPALTPKKLWPAHEEIRLGRNSGALELVSPDRRVAAFRQAPVAVVAVMRNEAFMLPHFLDHYRRMGVTAFAVADNGSDDGTLERLAEEPDVAAFSVDTAYAVSHYGVAWQNALMGLRPGAWTLVADADELLVWEWPQAEGLADLLSGPDFAKADAARVFMLDMYPEGSLAEAQFEADPFAEAGFTEARPFLRCTPLRGPFSTGETWTSALRHRLIPGSRPTLFVAQKYALLRPAPWMRLSDGLHYVSGARIARRELLFAHFKYNADFRRKAQEEVARRQHFNDAEEYRRYLALASEGRDRIHDPALSVRWTDSAFVRARLGRG
ncbi:glycosyltransferase involved in cell wall biosynthesis [Palleronia aestuarii]|uniref:Glycosyltransferase involved in cell wall biosynthesis n=1 Tax=Palleronia aestuarii TaxID=568105 RepID=A0A2W7N599_9RHOB|nr:glycosyltransferase [Palleronia aestuarii]PZX13497.1 glycosyltransferase involved in cell wall biosynthesis [Palleronia aestuarii]